MNKRGGGGAAAMNYFKTRPADGNTILMFTVGHAISMAAGKTKRLLTRWPHLAAAQTIRKSVVNCMKTKYKTPEEFVAGVKAGDKLTYGGTQSGTIDHITVSVGQEDGPANAKLCPIWWRCWHSWSLVRLTLVH